MNIEKLPSGSYRVRKMVDGKRYNLCFDHKPTEIEIAEKLIERTGSKGREGSKAFKVCAKEYIASKNNVISPTTIRGYESIIRNISPAFGKISIYELTQMDVQKEINRYAAKHSSKSTRNLSGFISSVIYFYRPNVKFHTTLPQKREFKGYCPLESDIKSILSEVDGTDLSIPYQLGILGLRRSEICAISHSDVKGNKLTVNKSKVQNNANKWIIKPYNKTSASNRVIYIPDQLAKEIKESKCAYEGHPEMLNRHLHQIQDKLGIPSFRFHDLRHYFASYAHASGMTDAEIMEMGGWNSDYTMKRVYREAMQDKKEKTQTKLGNSILSKSEPVDCDQS